MFDGIAEHESRETELPNAFVFFFFLLFFLLLLFFAKLLFFLLFLFNLFLFNDLINKC